MPTPQSTADRLLPMALAAAWPLGLLAQIPGTPLFLGPCLAASCGILALIVAIRSRACRPPFEYAFPVLLLALLAVALCAQGQISAGTSLLAGAGIFIAANVLVRARHDAIHALAAFSAACAVVAVANALTSQGALSPAAIDPVARIALAGAASIPEHVLLLLCGLLAGIVALTQPDSRPWLRGLMAIATLTTGAWLLSLAPHAGVIIAEGAPSAFSRAPRLESFALLLMLWLVARVSARAFLRPAHPDTPKPALLPTLVLVAAAAHLLLGRMPAPAVLFLLGLAAAHDAPWATPDRAKSPRWALPAILGVLAACLVVQFAGYRTFTAADPRNHVAISEDLFRDKSWGTLDTRLNFLLDLQPGRADLVVLSARSLLSQGRPEAAVDRFCEAKLNPGPASMAFSAQLPPERLFLDELRDATSALPVASRGLLFERALLHAGQQDSALNSLIIRKESADAGSENDPGMLRHAIAQLLGSQDFVERLEGWSGPELSGLLETGGIHVETLPPGYPAQGHPVVVRALSVPEGLRINVWGGSQPAPERLVMPGSTLEPEVESNRLRWGAWVQDGAGDWLLPLESTVGPLGTLDFKSPVSFEFTAGTLPQVESCATTVYLP